MSQAICQKIIDDMVKAVKQDTSLNSFEIVPIPSSESRNSSPVLRGGTTLGLESWAVKHILPYAHNQIKKKHVNRDTSMLTSCVLVVNLLHPEMPSAWNLRKELILQRKLSVGDEMRITRLALSRIPKCNEALAHRRWLISQNYTTDQPINALNEELDLSDLIADRYPSNYHAWSHRQWCLQKMTPPLRQAVMDVGATPLLEITKRDMCYVFTASTLPVYLNELEANLKFISSHVSDHSGLHYRTFLLNQIFSIFRNNLTGSKETNIDTGHAALNFYSTLKSNIVEFFDNVSHLQDYLSSLQYKITLRDIIISLILGELKSNASLSEMFPSHEALWCYRKFLVHSLHATLLKADASYNLNPASDFINQFYLSEQSVVNFHVHKAKDEYDTRILRNYCSWLNHVLKLEIRIQ